MKKILTFSILASSLLFADSVNEVFANGEIEGQIRGGYINVDPEGESSSDAFSLGGFLKYESGSFYGLKGVVGLYTSQGLGLNSSDKNGDFFNLDSKSYSLLGEAYLSYESSGFSLSSGRMLLDTPFADGDDIRMMPNMFEASVLSYSGISDLTLIGAYVTKWAGFDAGSPDKFIKLSGDGTDGTVMLAGIYSGLANTEIGAWYYGVDEIADIAYLDATYSMELDSIELEISGQYANLSQSNQSGVDGDVFGLSASVAFEGLSLSGAYNKASNSDGSSVINGFGGGPYFTSMDEMTIDGLEDAKAYLIGAEYDFSNLGLDGISLGVAYGVFEDSINAQETNEMDIVVAGEVAENVDFELIYASLEDDIDSKTPDFNFDRLLVRVNYNF